MKKEMIKAAFFDVDDTLYDHVSNQIPLRHLQALENLQKQGIKICLSTGRSLALIENLGILHTFAWDGIIAGNGSFVYDENLDLLFESAICPSSLQMIFQEAHNQNFPLFCSGNTVMIEELSNFTKHLLDDFHIKTPEIRSLQDTDRFSTITLCAPIEEINLTPFRQIPDVKVIENKGWTDVIKKELSKFKGISVFMQHHEYDPHAYIAFGDGYNDKEMLENATIGVRVIDGDPRLASITDQICPSAHEAGIYTYLQENGWF